MENDEINLDTLVAANFPLILILITIAVCVWLICAYFGD